MNDLALLAIGIGLGLALALVAVMTYVLYRSASTVKSVTKDALRIVNDSIVAQNIVVERLRGEVSLSLSRMDAERLYSASLTIQRTSKSLALQVETLQKALYASTAPAIDTAPQSFDLDDEAMDDQRLVQERARWQGAHSPQPGPLDGLSEADKAARVADFFAQRRRSDPGGIRSAAFASTPPAAGAGAYASLMEQVQATQPFQPRSAPSDFDDAVTDGVDLTEKGELG